MLKTRNSCSEIFPSNLDISSLSSNSRAFEVTGSKQRLTSRVRELRESFPSFMLRRGWIFRVPKLLNQFLQTKYFRVCYQHFWRFLNLSLALVSTLSYQRSWLLGYFGSNVTVCYFWGQSTVRTSSPFFFDSVSLSEMRGEKWIFWMRSEFFSENCEKNFGAIFQAERGANSGKRINLKILELQSSDQFDWKFIALIEWSITNHVPWWLIGFQSKTPS